MVSIYTSNNPYAEALITDENPYFVKDWEDLKRLAFLVMRIFGWRYLIVEIIPPAF
jgi:hypothetical protein